MNKKIFERLGRFARDNSWAIVVLFASGLLLWGSVSAMTKNWELSRTVEAKKRERELLKIENETLELENKYYDSEEYQELAARRQHGRALEGETMVLLPENSAAAKNKYPAPEKSEPPKLSNFQQWMAFLFGWKK